ncbi:MAG: HvfC/BufC N-terminal domain-containing protein [Alphaproteobacteria bacterium]
MTPLEKHINLMSGFARFQAEQSDLAPLMAAKVAPGQRALVYRNSGMLAIVGALRSNYPRLDALMGESFFSEMAKAYIHLHPVKQRSLVGFGERLAQFIDSQVSEHNLEWLGDLARLDRGWLEAHLAADSAPLPIERIAETPQEHLLAAKLEFHPSLRVVETRWDLGPLWQDIKSGVLPGAQLTLNTIPSAMMFWRPRSVVLGKSLSPEDYAFIEILRRGKTLADACSLVIDTYPSADLPVLIADIVSEDLITNLTFKEAHSHDNP